jgi:hypothetical protein
MRSILILFLLFSTVSVIAQNQTDISLKWKDSINQSIMIESNTGDLYRSLSHHGPAIENEWMGLRLYFDHKVSVDVYNKTKPGLELEAAGWYPTPEQQKEGWGADQYKVGSTVGLGGVRLWDGEKEMFLNPVTRRVAKVRKEASHSYMEMLSEGIPYRGDTIDVLVRVTVFSGMREAKVEAFAFSSKPVQFFTGVNHHPLTETLQGDGYMATWGIHPEDVAAFQLKIGSGLFYNPADFERVTKGKNTLELVSKPTKYMETWITSSCEKESALNTLESFFEYVKKYQK